MNLPPIGVLALLLAGGAAHAHLPHDEVTAVAAPANLDPSIPWFLVVSPSGSDLVLRSDDGGSMWQIVGGDPTMDSLHGGTMLADGTPVLLGEDGLWWSPDGGESWEYDALAEPPNDVMAVGSDLYVAGPRGLRFGTPGDLGGTALSGQEVTSLHYDGGNLMAITDDGVVNVRNETGSWEGLPAVGSGATAAAWDRVGARLYAADGDGAVYYLEDDAWQACGALPEMEHPGIHEMAVAGDMLLITPGDSGPWGSPDGCATWQDVTALTALYEVEGGAMDESHAFSSLEGVGDEWYVAGWDGWARTEDGGATWEAGFLVPVDFTRGVAFAPDYEQTGRAYIGGYAAGVIVAVDGGTDYIADGFGLYRYNSQKVYVAPDEPDVIYAVIGHSPWRSDDGGSSWVRLSETYVPTLNFTPRPGGEVWIIGTAVGSATSDVARSFDHGTTWQFVDAAMPALDNSISAHLTVATDESGADRLFVLAQKPVKVIRSDDDGASWTRVFEGPADVAEITEGIAWPPDGATTLVAGVGHEILRTTDWGDSWTVVADMTPDTLVAMAGADDGTIVAGLQSGRFLRSTDGGATWQDLGLQLNSAPRGLAVRPNFAEHDVMLVGTHDGVFAIEDIHADPPSVRRWGQWQVVDEGSQAMLCTTCPNNEKDLEKYPGAARDAVLRVESDMVLRTVLRGEVVRVLGAIDGTGSVTVEVGSPRLPGESVVISGDPTDGIVELARFELDDDWHEVEIRGVTGAGVVIDAVEGLTDHPPLAYEGGTGSDTGDGGADTGDGGTSDGGSGDGGSGDGGGTDTGTPGDEKCGNCSAAPGLPMGLLLPLMLVVGRRRR